MAKHARIGDPTTGRCSRHLGNPTKDGTITTGSDYCSANGIGMARQGDEVTASCGHKGIIQAGSGITFIKGVSAAREGDTFDGDYKGTIIGGSGDITTV